jgi:peptide/nickel transport system substrate-binding protein
LSRKIPKFGLLGLIAVAGVVFAVGTGSAAKPAPIDTTAIIRAGTSQAQTSGDPDLSATQYYQLMQWDRLFTFDGHGNEKPMLATSYQIAPDKKSIILHLRHDAYFHDGTPEDALAVKMSLDRARTLPGSAWSGIFSEITSEQILNHYTVKINLSGGGADLIPMFASVGGSIINPVCIRDNVSLTLIPAKCTASPMVVSSATPPTQWTYTKDTDYGGHSYWDPTAFKYAGLVMTLGNSASTLLNALQAHDLDFAHITADGIVQGKALIKQGVLGGKPDLGPILEGLFLNPRVPPFNNPLLRQAVQAAIDPTQVAGGYFAGNCVPSDQPALPGNYAYNSNFKETNPYNPTKAKALLTQAGVPNGFSFTMAVNQQASASVPAQIVQAQLAKVGINANVQLLTTNADPSIAQGTAPAFFSFWQQGIDPSLAVAQLLQLGQLRDAVVMNSDIATPFQALVNKSVDPSLTQTQRGQVYQQMWKMIYDNTLFTSGCLVGVMFLHQPNIGNAELPPYTSFGGGMDLRYIVERKSS